MNRLTTVAFALTALIGTCFAQEPAPKSSPQDPLVTVEFEGGSLADFARALRRSVPGVNIVMPTMAEAVEVPAVKLTDAPVGTALDAVARIQTGSEYEVNASVMYAKRGGKPVFSIAVREIKQRSSSRRASTKDRKVVEVFSIRSLVDPLPGEAKEDIYLTPESILSAIDAGVEVAGGVAATIKYHETTRILIVRGSVEQVNAITSILDRIERDMQQQRVSLANDRARKSSEARRKSGTTPNKSKNR